MMTLQQDIICLNSEAFRALLDEVIVHINHTYSNGTKQWLRTEEAMELLGISSKTTLQQLRDQGRIRYSQPQKKVILYDRKSIEDYLHHHARNTF